MQLYCRPIDGILFVLATHADGIDVPLSAYPDATAILPYHGTARAADLLGNPAPEIDLAAYAASRRYEIETGGITVGGAPIATDRDSQAMVANAFAYIQASGAASVSYKGKDGFVTLGSDQIKAVALAVGAHVQACFEAERVVDVGLSAAKPTITTLAQVDAAFAKLGA